MKILLEKEVDFKEILQFLEKIDADVSPPLTLRVDLREYAAKIADFAVCLVIRKNDEIEALSAFYCNDLKNGVSYLTLIAVSDSLRNQGVATKLLDETITYAKARNMKKIVLETGSQNQPALKLYLKYGFTIMKTEADGSVFMEYQLV